MSTPLQVLSKTLSWFQGRDRCCSYLFSHLLDPSTETRTGVGVLSTHWNPVVRGYAGYRKSRSLGWKWDGLFIPRPFRVLFFIPKHTTVKDL